MTDIPVEKDKMTSRIVRIALILLLISCQHFNCQDIPNNTLYSTDSNIYRPNQDLYPGYRPGSAYNSPERTTSYPTSYTSRNYFTQSPRDNVLTRDSFDENFDKSYARQPTYFVVASKIVRPGLIYQVLVSILQTNHSLTIYASISKDGVEVSGDKKDVKEGISEALLMRIPPTSTNGTYRLRVKGLYSDIFGGTAFSEETELQFSYRSMTIFIQTDKPIYMQGEIVRFRTIPLTTELKGFNSAMDVYMIDPTGHILRRWLSRQSNLGSLSLQYKLSDQLTYGKWTIRVIAQGQVEEGHFDVEEYYQSRFEVNVTMPAFFFRTDPFIHGSIMTNFTSGAPVKGNLTLKAIIRPVGLFNAQEINYNSRVNLTLMNEYSYNYGNRYNGLPHGATGIIGPNNVGDSIPAYQDRFSTERYFNFDEEWPFWIEKPYGQQVYDYETNSYKNKLPYLRFFNGTYDFKFPISEFENLLPINTDIEVLVVATVGEQFYNEIINGYAVTRISNSSVKLNFLGDSPQVFKPSKPFTTYLAISYHDGSEVKLDPINPPFVDINGYVEGRSGRRELPSKRLQMSEIKGIWEFKMNLRYDLNLADNRQGLEFLNNVESVRIRANYIGTRGEQSEANLLLLAHRTPLRHHLKVSTSTIHPKVGEYIIFHIRCNFFIETFNYIILSKGIILLHGEEVIEEGVKSMAVTLSPEMSPSATIVIWQIDQQQNIIADSLEFPVNGISRNNFTVFINPRKARTGDKVEVAIYGEPGTYVALSGIDNAFYTMQAGNELSYSKVIMEMMKFDENRNFTLYKQAWHSHEGNPDRFVHFPTASLAIDPNRTFEYAGLLIFTDARVPRRNTFCNETLGFKECVSGKCYRIKKRCDGYVDCDDGSDESNCHHDTKGALAEYRKYRFNRIKRHFDNVWLWRDCNIGPHGRFIFNIEVPKIPAYWSVSAFSISPSKGFGMLTKPLEYAGIQPFFINVEMPTECRQGEQIGIRVTVFNFMTTAVESTVVLHGSPDYKFVHVEEGGIVRSYNPRTSYGEHQFFIYLEPQETTVVYIPIVPTRLGDIDITVHAGTLLGTDQITRRIHVESDGLPQHRHQSILLDLSSRAYVLQYMHVNVTETPIIPYQVERYFVYGSNRARVSVVGDVVGPIFPTMPVNATSLLNLPMESAEQNMFSFAANLYTIMYMRLINKRNKTLEKQAFQQLNVLYQRQMSFMKEDGSFSLFRSDWNNSASSVWLTAYCAKIFGEASFYEWENYIYIDPTIIQKSIRWIIQHQSPEGSFYEITWYPDRKMNRTISPLKDDFRQRNISLTAHVLITLATAKDLSGNLGARVALAQQKAIAWIERNIKFLNNTSEPYEVAISAYALMLARAATAEQVFRILRGHAREIGEYVYFGKKEVPQPPSKLENQKYFSLPRLPYEYDSQNIETTAYALLVYVSRREFFLDPIVRWLNAQRLNEGGWESTQDTSVALKALIEYTVYSRIREVSSLMISVEATSLPGETNRFYIKDKNLAHLQYLEFPNAWGTVKVQANGAGYAILQMHVQYNVDNPKFQTEPPVKAFDLNVRSIFHGRNQSHISLLSCQRWINTEESPRSGMAVLDVTIPTGYFMQQQRLDKYVLSHRVRNLQRAKYLERKVLFYFEYLDQEDICVNFTVERWYPVANMSRYLPIRIYDYYAPERFNETIFDALPTYLLNICEVCGSSQCPYCSIYNNAYQLSACAVLLIVGIGLRNFLNFLL